MKPELVERVELGRGYSIEYLVDGGQPRYRVCYGGIQRVFEDEFYAWMYLSQLGWTR